jgi:hypothetical protein
LAAECYRRVIEFIRRCPENYEPGLAKRFATLADGLDNSST